MTDLHTSDRSVWQVYIIIDGCIQVGTHAVLVVPVGWVLVDTIFTVGSTRTVDGGCGILQYRNRLDFVRVDTVQTTGTSRYTVDNHQRVVATQRVGTTYADSCSTTTRFVWTLETDHTRHTTDHTVGQVRSRRGFQFFTLQAGHRTSHGYFLLNTITNDYHFVDLLGIFDQRYIDWSLVTNRNFLRAVTDIGEDKGGIGRNFQCIVTIHVCNDTDGRSLNGHVHTDQRFAVWIDNRSFEQLLLRESTTGTNSAEC